MVAPDPRFSRDRVFIAAVKLTQASSVGLINKVLVEVLAGIIILAPATIPILLEVTAPATLALLVRTLTRLVKPRRRAGSGHPRPRVLEAG